jgi:hypothetical protein
LPGGFLGVNANISVALLFYAILLSWLSRNRPDCIKYMKKQAGGDDVFILTKTRRSDMLKVRLWIDENLRNYVGYVKELNSFIVEDSCDSPVVNGIKFCRKRIQVRSDNNYYYIKSEPAVPLNEVFTAVDIPNNPRAQQKIFNTVRSELDNFSRENQDYAWISGTLLAMASSKLPKAQMTKTLSIKYDSELSYSLVDNRLCSESSIQLSRSVSMISHLTNIYYGTIPDSINYLLARGKLVLQLVTIEGKDRKVIMTEREGKAYRKHCVWRSEVPVIPAVDFIVLHKLTN